ncbi:MAG: dihydropteroate synthase [Nitrospiria bacterium]
MGILNVTPDSFSDGGSFLTPQKAIDRALQLEDEGADLIDIGGESTRPGALPVSLDEELRRVLPVIECLSGRLNLPISIDTTKSEVAQSAVGAGASIINDVSGFTRDLKMFSVAASGRTGLVMMHAKGTPQVMQKAPRYKNLIGEIAQFLDDQLEKAIRLKIQRNRIAIDPGLGFGKTLDHNLSLIHSLDRFTTLGVPVMLGPSRKSFIGKILDLPASDRLEGTAAAVAISVFQGARIFRIHDVEPIKRVIQVAERIRKNRSFHG